MSKTLWFLGANPASPIGTCQGEIPACLQRCQAQPLVFGTKQVYNALQEIPKVRFDKKMLTRLDFCSFLRMMKYSPNLSSMWRPAWRVVDEFSSI
jgi:hypothetical protein